MGYYSKQASIFLGGLLVCVSYTFISPFYPGIAQAKGIPIWMIGVIFSLDPIFALISSLILGKYMYKIGRRFTLVLGIGLLAGSMFAISLIEFFDLVPVLILSVISRILGGIGYGCEMTAGDAILSSDYPGEVTKMMGVMEAFCGAGLIIGPLLGSVLYVSGGVFLSFMLSGLVLALYTPVAYFLLGEPKPYDFSDEQIDGLELLLKPKIALDAGAQFSVMFTFGFLFPILELHLLSFNIRESYIGLCFALYTASYCIFSIIAVTIPKKVDMRLTMTLGLLTLSICYTMIGPWDVIYPRELWVVLLGLVVIGLSTAFLYIPSLPHMIDLAYDEYHYKKDDRIIDELAGISNIIMNAGEIVGPLMSGFMNENIDLGDGCTILACIFFAYFGIYLYGSGLISKAQTTVPKSDIFTELMDI